MAEADTNTAMLLGEVRGQLRELIHTVNNRAQENAHIVKQLAKLEDVPKQLETLSNRMTALEADKNRRDGAMSIGGWLMRSNAVVYLIMLAGAAWAYVKGVFSS